MRQFARYVDDTMSCLLNIVETARYDALRQACDEDIISVINDSLDEQRDALQKMTDQMDEIDGLGDLIKSTRSAIEELKRYGLLCQMPLPPMEDRREKPPAQAAIFTERARSPALSPRMAPDMSIGRRSVTSTPKSGFRTITKDEYDTLPQLVVLLVKLEELNKNYQAMMETGKTRFNSSELPDIVMLSPSRMKAFLAALVSLNRISNVDDGDSYTLL